MISPELPPPISKQHKEELDLGHKFCQKGKFLDLALIRRKKCFVPHAEWTAESGVEGSIEVLLSRAGEGNVFAVLYYEL